MKFLGKVLLSFLEAIILGVVIKMLSVEIAILVVLVQIYLEMTFGDFDD